MRIATVRVLSSIVAHQCASFDLVDVWVLQGVQESASVTKMSESTKNFAWDGQLYVPWSRPVGPTRHGIDDHVCVEVMSERMHQASDRAKRRNTVDGVGMRRGSEYQSRVSCVNVKLPQQTNLWIRDGRVRKVLRGRWHFRMGPSYRRMWPK